MKINQIEQLYYKRGLNDCKLSSAEDMLNIHGVDVYKIDGFKYLSDEHKKLFLKFIINFFNAWGLEMRNILYPLSINFVRETEFLGKQNENDDYYIIFGNKVEALRDKDIKVLSEWKDKNNNLRCITTEEKFYLKFNYKINGQEEWQHVINEKEWY